MSSATGKRTIELTTRKTQKTRESARRTIPAHLASDAGEGLAYWPRSRRAASGDQPGSVLECYTGGPRRLSPPARRWRRARSGGKSALESDVDIGATWAGGV